MTVITCRVWLIRSISCLVRCRRGTVIHSISNNLVGPASNLNIRKTLVEQHTPEIVLHGLVNNTDVEKLFDM
jgi:hypothetical protein